MEVNKINNITSTTTVHIIWYDGGVESGALFFDGDMFLPV